MSLVLFQTFPALTGNFPSLSLCGRPTPIQKLEKLGEAVGHDDLWIKRDDLTHELYGGNKVRKLDFILARAAERRVRAVVTSGAYGSHHILATCKYGKKFGFETGAVQFPVPADPHLEKNQRIIHETVKWEIMLRSTLLVPYGYWSWKRQRLEEGYGPEELMLIPPGGSSPLGCLGYVNAALEIEKQREESNLPPFDAVYTALGTCGTFCGLSLGFKIARASGTSVIGVRVASPLVANRWTASWLSLRTARLLSASAAGGELKTLLDDRKINAVINDKYLGGGYAIYGKKEREVMDLLEEKEGIILDPVYTAKAMRAFLDHARTSSGKNNKLLFTLTCDNGIKGGG